MEILENIPEKKFLTFLPKITITNVDVVIM